MPEAALYPDARFHPLGAQTETRMTGHDVICLHTMVGYLISTDGYFRISNGPGYRGTESHFGIGGPWGPDLGGGLDGATWQWQDLAFGADANLDGKQRVISIETADNAPARPEDIAAWSPAQLDEIVDLVAWLCTRAAHAKCPTSWECHRSGIPPVLIPDTKPYRRGIGWHAQGVPGVGLVPGGVQWSNSPGKSCPTRRRIEQLHLIVVPRVRAKVANPPIPEEDEMTQEMVERAVRKVLRLPETGLAVPRGLTHNGDAFVRLLEMDRQAFNADNALRATLAAVVADDRLDDAATERISAKVEAVRAEVAEILRRTAAPEVPPAGPGTPTP